MDDDWQADAYHPKGRRLRLMLTLLALLATLLSFSAVGSVVGELGGSSWWMLVGSGAICAVTPLALALWLRRLAGADRRAPGAIPLLLLLNLLVLLVLVVLAGDMTQRALRTRGAWWVSLAAEAMDLPPDNALERRARTITSWLAGHIPSKEGDAQHTQRSARATGKEPRERSNESAAPTPPQESEGVPWGPPALPGTGEGPSPTRDTEAAETPDPSAGNTGSTTIAFERHGRAIVVPVRLRGPRLQKDVRMLFDTGATLSTIDSRTLADLGLYINSSDPTVTLRTANGAARRTITVIDGAEVQGARVDGGLTVALCDACGDEEVVGLLGLNFARHFRVTVDHAAGTLGLEAKQIDPGRLYDIRPFVRLTDIKGVQRGGLLRITLWLENRSPRPLRDVRLLARAGGDNGARLTGEVSEVDPGRKKVHLEGQVPASADGFRVEITGASW